MAEVDLFGQKLVDDPKVVQFQSVSAHFQGAKTYTVMDTIKKLAEQAIPINSFWIILLSTTAIAWFKEIDYYFWEPKHGET